MDFDDDINTKEEIDPASEFLAREQSVLGDLESEINSGSNNVPSSEPADDSLFAADGNELAPTIAGIESSTGSFEMIAGEINESSDIPVSRPTRVESEKIRKWREDQKQRLEEKDREEERKKEELRAQAKQELQDWLRQTEENIAKTKTASRNAEKQASALENGTASGSGGAEWERIANLCDFNPKVNKSGKDISRMRSIYLHLKQNPIVTPKSA